jgi:nicotinamidase-related amidase
MRLVPTIMDESCLAATSTILEASVNTLPRGAALVIIDVQKGLDDPAYGRRNNPEAELNISRLLAAWRRAHRPIVHVQHLSLEPDSPLRPGQPGVEIKDMVQPRGDEPVIQKHVNTAFIGTDLEERLRVQGIDTVVITGLTTDHCVSATTRMAGDLGFRTYLVSDATATFDRAGPDGVVYQAEDVHGVSLASLDREFATVVDTDSVLQLFPDEGTADGDDPSCTAIRPE